MINIILNGKQKKLDQVITINELINQLSKDNPALKKQRYAVEINQQIIPKSQHNQVNLAEQDKVEIVGAIGGG